MKKTLLLTIVIALMAVVFFGCSNQVQPVSGDVGAISKQAGAPAVSNLAATAHLGGFFIRWDAAEDVSNYTLYRKTVKGGVVDEASFVRVGSSSNLFSWYSSADLEHEAVYIFGVDAQDAKWGRSEIVWLEKDKAVTANYPAQDSKVPFLDAADYPKIAVEAVDTYSQKTTGYINRNDQIKVTLTNLKPGYSYFVGYQTTNVAAPSVRNDWTTQSGSIGGSSGITPTSSYDTSVLLTGETVLRGGGFGSGITDDSKARVVVTVSPIRGSFEVTYPASTDTSVDAKNSDQFLSAAVSAKK